MEVVEKFGRREFDVGVAVAVIVAIKRKHGITFSEIASVL